MNASSLEAPCLSQSTEIPPSLIGTLEVRGLRRDARRPRRIKVVGRVDHRVRRHRHAVLARDRLEERTHGVFPAAAGHARPLLPDGAEVLEESALARLDLDRVRVAYLEAADRRLESPAPDVVRVSVPDDSDRWVHARPGPHTRRFAK